MGVGWGGDKIKDIWHTTNYQSHIFYWWKVDSYSLKYYTRCVCHLINLLSFSYSFYVVSVRDRDPFDCNRLIIMLTVISAWIQNQSGFLLGIGRANAIKCTRKAFWIFTGSDTLFWPQIWCSVSFGNPPNQLITPISLSQLSTEFV